MELFGRPTINPLLFYSGKISGYITWAMLFYSLSNYDISNNDYFNFRFAITICLSATGLMLIALSLIHLGKSTRFGLPVECTEFKKNGIYKFSRNPMYFGFNLLTIASIIYTINVIIMILGIFSIIVYHIIILSEENFLYKRFGIDYMNYRKKVRRYL